MGTKAVTETPAGYTSPADQLARMAYVRRGVRKARKIRRVLERELGPAPWPEVRGLDLGCGPGTIAAYLGRLAGSFVGVDVDRAALDIARSRFRYPNLEFLYNAEPRLPFDDASFDLIVANHVYEHVRDVEAFFEEVRRLIKPAGRVYLAAAGKYQLLEPHYKLPFLSWLPGKIADAYLKLAGREEDYDVHLVSYRRLFRLLEPFDVREYTAAVVAEPERFGAAAEVPANRVLRRLAAFLARRAPSLSPTRIFVLRPKGARE
ncbi:MAG: class I SAM-dependent methyltransferase [Candidatus Zixiibacteriota bacterium]